eukprot:Phypoly_transcript_22717.p1 GENE.Phypoly_transcript_22717~~Phypoly_transcript_22717.p1  ORF type:complete len:167 (+),score=24.83 Phypoly_transcript_22717:29-502(+)
MDRKRKRALTTTGDQPYYLRKRGKPDKQAPPKTSRNSAKRVQKKVKHEEYVDDVGYADPKMNAWFNKLPGTIAWKAGRNQWFTLKKSRKFDKGVWVAVNGDGDYCTAATREQLFKKVAKLKWFSPYYECVGVPVPPQIARRAEGTARNWRTQLYHFP